MELQLNTVFNYMGFLFLSFLALSYICLILIHKLNSYDLEQSKMVKIQVLPQIWSEYYYSRIILENYY